MIKYNSRFRMALVPIAQIVVSECQSRYPDRALHYHRLLTEHEDDYCGPVALTPHWESEHIAYSTYRYDLLDGHHRYVAHVLAGRERILALIEYRPGMPGYDTASVIELVCEDVKPNGYTGATIR